MSALPGVNSLYSMLHECFIVSLTIFDKVHRTLNVDITEAH